MTRQTVPAQYDAEGAPHRPTGHRATTPAFSSLLETDTIVYAQLGVQHPADRGAAARTLAALDHALAGPHGPVAVDRAVHVDPLGHHDEIAMAYWPEPDAYAAWAAETAAGVFAEVPTGEVGVWREVLTIPRTRIQTIHSSDRRGQGVTHFAPVHPTDVHEYEGAARDRIPAARHDALAPTISGLCRADRPSRGERVAVRAPDNVCFIRSGQDWSQCGDGERGAYLDEVAPALRRGTDYLRDAGPQAGCISGRFAQELGADGRPVEKTCFLGFFVSLEHLERWSWSHETHDAIFASFMRHVAAHGGAIDLALWGEVSVLTSDAVELEYLNCHPHTGFLTYGTEGASHGAR